MAQAIVCSHCGAKMRTGRERCPRCGAHVTETSVDPNVAAAATLSATRRLLLTTSACVAGFVLLVGGLWILREPGRDAGRGSGRPADPLAGRREANAPVAVSALSQNGPLEAPPEFLDPSDAGALAYHSGDYGVALQHFHAAVERNPQDAEALSNLGQVLVRLGRTRDAIPYFDRAIGIDPGRWAYHFNLGRALGLMGNWDAAIAAYRTAQDLFPADYATTFNLALALHKKGDEVSAIEQYKKAIELNPDDASFRLALATSYERLQEPAEAAAAYREYLRLTPSGPEADKVRARVALLTGVAPAAAAVDGQGPG